MQILLHWYQNNTVLTALQDIRFYHIIDFMNDTATQTNTLAANSLSAPQGTDTPVIQENGELDAMMKAGIHFGHAKSKNHPSMKPYIYGIRNTISVLDLTETKKALERAIDFLRQTASDGKMILFVGTRPAARAIVREIAQKTNMPFVTERWLGGTMTNFSVIRQRVEYLERLERERKTGEMEKYTKKERIEKTKEIERLEKNFAGLRAMTRQAEVLCVVNIGEDQTAVREARRKNIPIVALADTNSNITGIAYPIPSNDDALPAVRYMMERIGAAVEEGIRNRSMRKHEAETAPQPAKI